MLAVKGTATKSGNHGRNETAKWKNGSDEDTSEDTVCMGGRTVKDSVELIQKIGAQKYEDDGHRLRFTV